MINETMKRTARYSEAEKARTQSLVELFKDAPIPEDEILANLGLFINRQNLTRILWAHELYQKIMPVAGVIMEFGCRWGTNLALFESLRGMYEPYNYSRKIVGFDTFGGFTALDEKDASPAGMKPGDYAVSQGYEKYLEKILDCHELDAPISHIKKYQIVKGDAPHCLEKYLKDNPETIIALAYFDMDMYEPTKQCLELIKDRLTRGSVIGFDELVSADFPGETVALREVLGLDKYKIIRDQRNSLPTYVVIE